jgi:hypothetical protein
MRIVTGIPDIQHYLAQVRSLADSNSDALGFLPASAYAEQAQRGRLWVAVEEGSGRMQGLLLFGGQFPSLKIFHGM